MENPQYKNQGPQELNQNQNSGTPNHPTAKLEKGTQVSTHNLYFEWNDLIVRATIVDVLLNIPNSDQELQPL